MDLTKYKEILSDTKATKRILTKEVETLTESVNSLKVFLKGLTEARDVVSTACILAQDNTKKIFESLITKALQTIFGEEYSFELESRFFRNQPEMEMFVVENGEKYSPKDEKGGAIIDTISVMSRIVSWLIQVKPTDNVILLDEPFVHLAKVIFPFLGQLIQDISEELSLQIIIVTHESDLAEYSNNTYVVKKKNGISEVKKLI